jgi:hypothetical protein
MLLEALDAPQQLTGRRHRLIAFTDLIAYRGCEGALIENGDRQRRRQIVYLRHRSVEGVMRLRKMRRQDAEESAAARDDGRGLHGLKSGPLRDGSVRREAFVAHDVLHHGLLPRTERASAGGAVLEPHAAKKSKKLVVKALLGLDREIAPVPVHELDVAARGSGNFQGAGQGARESGLKIAKILQLPPGVLGHEAPTKRLEGPEA